MFEHPIQLTFRAYQPKDYNQLKVLMEQAYFDLKNPSLSETEMLLLHEIYPQGQILCFDNHKLVAASMNRIVATDKYVQNFTESEANNKAIYKSDALARESVYAIDFVVMPSYQCCGVAMQLRLALHKQIFEIDNFKALVGVSRLPNYFKYHENINCETYIEKVKRKEIHDPVLNFHFSHNMETRAILPNFNPDDKRSCGYGVSVILKNGNYNASLPTYLSFQSKPINSSHVTQYIYNN